MAYSEQTFTNLGGVQAPDPSLSETFAGGNFDAFKISDQTNQLLNQVSREAQAKRENEVKQFNANLQTQLVKASEIQEGLNPQDYEVAQTKSKDAIKYLYDNMEILSGKSPEKQRKFNEMLVDISTFAQLSKGTKKVEDTYNEFIKKDADWSNPVNTYYLEEYRKGTPQEKAQKAFTPIKNPINDFQTLVVPKLQANAPTETRTEVDPNDAGKLIVYQDKVFDENVYVSAFKNYNGQYLTEEWKVRKAQGDTNIPDTPEEYIKVRALETFVPKITSKSSVTNNVSYVEGKKNERNQASIEGREAEGAANRATRLQVARERASIKNPSYELVADGEYKIDRMLESKKPIEGVDVVKKVYPNVSAVYRIDTDVPPEISNKLYSSKNSEDYGVLYEVVPKSGAPYYLKATTINLDSKGRKLPEGAAKADIASVSVVPDTSTKFSKDALLENVVGSSQKGKAQLEEYRKANKEVKTIESESDNKGAYRGVNEMFYTPIGITVDRGVERKGTLSNPKEAAQHNDHVHLAFDNSDVAVEIMDEAKRRGLSVRGNPYAGKNTHSKNTSLGRASAHGLSFGNGVGKGADIGHDNTDKERKDFFMWVQENYGGGKSAPTTTVAETTQSENYVDEFGATNLRNDGTNKGNGFFGVLKMKDGSNKDATEISIGVEIDGKETEIPTLVPTLSEEEKDWLLKGGNPLDKSEIAESITIKAIAHAEQRIKEGKSPFNDTPPSTNKTQTTKGKFKFNPKTGKLELQ